MSTQSWAPIFLGACCCNGYEIVNLDTHFISVQFKRIGAKSMIAHRFKFEQIWQIADAKAPISAIET
jgi:hypothetical protein